MLNEQRRIQLDNIVKQMMVNGEKENTIQFVVDDFKKKYEYENVIQPQTNKGQTGLAGFAGKILKGGSDFLFGNLIKTTGGIIQGGYESGKELITGKKIENKQGYSVAPEMTSGKKLSTPQIIGAGLESTIGGVGEKTVAKIAGKLSAPLIKRAEKIYQSALKPTNALIKKSPDVVKTGLKEGIRVSESGLGKLQ